MNDDTEEYTCKDCSRIIPTKHIPWIIGWLPGMKSKKFVCECGIKYDCSFQVGDKLPDEKTLLKINEAIHKIVTSKPADKINPPNK